MTKNRNMHWFRQDLRVSDNLAFYHACEDGEVLPVFILDDKNAGKYKIGSASRVWLHHALDSLNKSLAGKLCFYKGDAQKILLNLVQVYKIDKVFWNRCYEQHSIRQSEKIKLFLKKIDVSTYSYNSALIHEPWEIKKDDGNSYRVFTAFYRKALGKLEPPLDLVSKPTKINFISGPSKAEQKLENLSLISKLPWQKKIVKNWNISETDAQKKLDSFIISKLENYKNGRDFPAQKSISRLSPYLHFGQISPQQIYFRLSQEPDSVNKEHFIKEIYWREFSYNLLYSFPDLPFKNFQKKFDNFPWQKNSELLLAWQKGLTGYPLVDAGMRELWQTGYMHNRVRMVVASFLVKNLLIHWREGEKWFWDCLVDADLASNSASWQWVAGCGADAAPYFRIFNPITQGEKFDADGAYTKKYIPELSRLPDKYLFKPFEAPEQILCAAGVTLGHNYPFPIVNLKWSRERALNALASLKNCKKK